MSREAAHISQCESELIQSQSRAARALDQALARDTHGRRLAGETSSAGYLRELGVRGPLAPAQERQLVLAAKDGDPAAREQLIEALLPRIAGVARVYRETPAVTRLELMQEGVVGLLRGLERFDPERGVPFWAFARWWVRQSMQQLISELTRPAVLSDRALRELSQIKREYAELSARLGRQPNMDELASATGLAPGQIQELLAANRAPQALEAPVADTDGVLGAFGDLLADPLAEGAYEALLDDSEIEQVRALLGSLSERERTVLRARYGLDGPERSLREIGERLGLSAERVRQIEAHALGKLRAAMRRDSSAEAK